jgi:hypothetical protein
MRIGLLARALLALPALLPQTTAAQNTGELWEITMSMPGMPAGMVPAQRVCQGDDPARAATQDKSKRDCKVTDKKQTGNRTTVSMSCPDGSTMVIDQTYNAARTEFKSTMSMKSKKDGDMTMSSTGRKVGACDAAQAKREQDAKMAAVKKQVAVGQAQGAAAMKQAEDQMIKECSMAVDKMQSSGLGIYGHCYRKPENDKDCKRAKSPESDPRPEVAKSCNGHVVEFCKRLQTANGYMKAGSEVESSAAMCGVSTKGIKASLCPRAEKDGSLGFLGAYCPVQAKPLAEVQCTGREFTSRQGGKYAAFCMNYMANADFESGKKQRPTESAPAQSQQQNAPPASQPQSTGDQVKQGVSKGIDKLKGLFGR